MVVAFSVPVAKVGTAAKQAADDDVPDFEVPSGVGSSPRKKKIRLPEAAAFELALHTFSDDCALFGFPGPPEPVITAIYDHAAYPSLVFKQTETREQFHNEKMLQNQISRRAPRAWTRHSS